LESNQPAPKTSSNNKKKLAIIAITVLVVASAAGLTYGLITSNPTNNGDLTQSNIENSNPSTTPNIVAKTPTPSSSLTKGSYAIYQGKTEIMSMPISFEARMEITDLNDTHLEISTSFDMSTPYGSTENTTSIWISKSDMNFQPEGLDLNKTYTAQVTIPNLGTRSCTVYEYENKDFKATFYVDNVLNWPIKITMTSPVVEGQSYNMDVSLIESNIPGL
jgi:hypothetical protein